MRRLADSIRIFILCGLCAGCHGQQSTQSYAGKTGLVGGGCDGCELMYIGMPKTIGPQDTSPGWFGPGQKLVVTGTVYKRDGRTAAPNVILYYWQTDHRGYYSPGPGMSDRIKRHGHIRGWVKTDTRGRYTIRTVRPAAYPGETIPAHIHLSIKEPGIANEYYPDEINFDDDKLLLPHIKRFGQENRGGSGVVRVMVQDSVQIAEHNIILGLNIPNYPYEDTARLQSGLNIGEDQPSFNPFHAYGPDKGSITCPVCKYGRFQGIIYFAGNHPVWKEVESWMSFLENENIKRPKSLKVYFVFGKEIGNNKPNMQKRLEQIGAELKIRYSALTYVPSFADKASDVYLNKINPKAENTIIIYKNSNIVDKYINVNPCLESFGTISESLHRTNQPFRQNF